MKKQIEEIIEQFSFEKGIEIDIDEGYPKIISSQFGGDPGKGFKELIQNLIDSYPSTVPLEERRGEITAGRYNISITDYGTGMSFNQLKLLLTLGGTDKDNDPNKIGQWGIGFFSIFNPKLATRKVVVTTLSDGQVVELIFNIISPLKKPEISINVSDTKIDYSTRITVYFDLHESVNRCLRFAEKSLTYYPCRITINGKVFRSVWEKAKQNGFQIYQNGQVSGFIENNYYSGEEVTVLCKYEYLHTGHLASFPKGGRNMYGDLRDFENKSIPYITGYASTINNNILTLTISRDNYYLDYYHELSVDILRKMLMDKFTDFLKYSTDRNIIIANHFIFRGKIRDYLANPESYTSTDPITLNVIKQLANAKVYSLIDKYYLYSLAELKRLLSADMPLFFTETRENTRWLGGDFKHDFIVAVSGCSAYRSTPGIYSHIFSNIFRDVVDLDHIQKDSKKIGELVKRNIINKSALTPAVKFVGEKELNKEQAKLLRVINTILQNKEVREAISETIKISIRNIHAIFFEIQEEGAFISTGLFTAEGEPLSDDYISNFEREEDQSESARHIMGTDILLGLRIDHPIIASLIAGKNAHNAYYALTYIAHELAMCQRMLVPYSVFFHWVKEKTAAAMRKALIRQMLLKKSK